MDPVTGAGIALGVGSLVLEIFDRAFKAFKFFAAVVDVPKDCQRCRLQLIIEYNRFLAWGEFVGLVNAASSEHIARCLGTNAMELCGTISRIAMLLEEFKELSARWKAEMQPVSLENVHEPQIVLQGVSTLACKYESRRESYKSSAGFGRALQWLSRRANNALDVAAHPSRLRWVMADRDAFEALLKDLHFLTTRIHELMRGHQENKLLDITAQTYRELVVMRNDLTEIRDMFEAVTAYMKAERNAAEFKMIQQDEQSETLRNMLHLKHLERKCTNMLERSDQISQLEVTAYLREMISVPRHNTASFKELFNPYTLSEVNNMPLASRSRGYIQVSKNGVTIREEVWVEWKYTEGLPRINEDCLESTIRIATLAEMLACRRPRQLFTPTCVGYIDENKEDRVGWIFKMPGDSSPQTQLMNLHSRLSDGKMKPTLTQRTLLAWKLCSTILCLHATDWIHKGIHSGNIVFPQENDGVIKIEDFFLSGFEYSRPQSGRTTGYGLQPRWNIYRWPRIQNQLPDTTNSRKTYDIYSVGLVLLEIAHWKPLAALMNLSRWPNRSSQDARIRGWLLSELPLAPFGELNPLDSLRDIVGDKYWRATRRCLVAHGSEGMGIGEEDDQSRNSAISMELQAAFTETVVEELKTVSI